MRQYHVKTKDGTMKRMSHIGVNFINEEENNNLLSTYDKAFDNEDVIMIMDGNDTYYCTLGNIMEAYVLLRNSIASKNPRNIMEYIGCIQDVMLAYFGNSYSVTKRIRSLNNHQNNYQISDLAHQNSAIGIERAMLAQNLLWEVDVNSVYKIGIVMLNNKPTIHAYNIVSFDGKHYIFDSTMPTINNGLISPIICEISEDVFNKIISPIASEGVNIEIEHFNPLKNKDISITYDVNLGLINDKSKQKIKRGNNG